MVLIEKKAKEEYSKFVIGTAANLAEIWSGWKSFASARMSTDDDSI